MRADSITVRGMGANNIKRGYRGRWHQEGRYEGSWHQEGRYGVRRH